MQTCTESCRENVQNYIDFYECDLSRTTIYDERKREVTEEFRFPHRAIRA